MMMTIDTIEVRVRVGMVVIGSTAMRMLVAVWVLRVLAFGSDLVPV